MRHSTHKQRSLFGPWIDWQEFPEEIRQQACDVLMLLMLEAIDTTSEEINTDDSSEH